MKKVFLVLILVLSVVMFSAPYNTKIRVLLWDEVLTQALKSAIPEFEKKTGIKVELDLLPSAQVFPKITTSVSLKSTDYDLVAVDEPFIPMLAPLLEPFTSWPQTKVYQRPNFSDFMPLAFEASRWNGIFTVYLWVLRFDQCHSTFSFSIIFILLIPGLNLVIDLPIINSAVVYFSSS